MAKNRYYKTTAGVPFEFAFGNSVPVAGGVTAEKMADVITSGTKGEVRVMRTDSTLDTPYTVVANTALATAYAKQQVFLSYVTKAGEVRNTAPMVANTITAKVIAYAAPTLQVVECLNDGLGTVSLQQRLSFKIIETTPGAEPLPKWSYDQALLGGEAAAWTDIATKINLGNDNEFFTAVANATGITITSTDASRHFRLAADVILTKADPNESGVTYTSTQTTAAFEGSGTLDQVERLFEEAMVRDGVTHYYVDQSGTSPADFGLPTKVADTIATTTFDIVVLSGYKTEASKTPQNVLNSPFYVFVAVPAGDGTKISAIFA